MNKNCQHSTFYNKLSKALSEQQRKKESKVSRCKEKNKKVVRTRYVQEDYEKVRRKEWIRTGENEIDLSSIIVITLRQQSNGK